MASRALLGPPCVTESPSTSKGSSVTQYVAALLCVSHSIDTIHLPCVTPRQYLIVRRAQNAPVRPGDKRLKKILFFSFLFFSFLFFSFLFFSFLFFSFLFFSFLFFSFLFYIFAYSPATICVISEEYFVTKEPPNSFKIVLASANASAVILVAKTTTFLHFDLAF
jgi:hypothetical protein